jgi:hypothetical protein
MSAISMRRVLTVVGPIVFGMCMVGFWFVFAPLQANASTPDKASLVLIASTCITVFLLAFVVAVWAFVRLFSGLVAENLSRLRAGNVDARPKVGRRILEDGGLFVAACLAGIAALEVLNRAT